MTTGNSHDLSARLFAASEGTIHRSARISGSDLDASGEASVPSTSTGRSDDFTARRCAALLATSRRSAHILGSHLGTSGDVSVPSTSTERIIQAHLEPSFVSTEEAREVAAKVQAKLS